MQQENVNNYSIGSIYVDCPDHPDVGGCIPFLQNATNKKQNDESSDLGCAQTSVICFFEQNPEKYCLTNDDSPFCNELGDLCDEDGFVKPEYPYCHMSLR
jgi:hypothetical protein